MTLNVKLLEIPYEAPGTDKNGVFDKSLPRVAGKSKFLNFSDRIIIVADIDGYVMPFYLSTGYGAKENVTPGKWYPFFGAYNDDGEIWLNKSDSNTIAAYYHSDVLTKICTQLDKTIGDIRKQSDTFPKPSVRSNRAIDFINQSFTQTTPNKTPNTVRIVSENIAAATAALDNIYKRSKMRDATGKIPVHANIPGNLFQKQND